MDVGILTGGLSPNIHRSTAVASHSLIRLLLACFCSFAERSRFNRIDPKHYLPQAYGNVASSQVSTRGLRVLKLFPRKKSGSEYRNDPQKGRERQGKDVTT